MLTVAVFILILSLLIFVHELGHFVTAKKAGIVVEEFGIGYPPRALKIWQDEGKITLNGENMVIGRRTNVPRDLQKGNLVLVETQTRPDGHPEVTTIELVKLDDDDDAEIPDNALAVESLEKPTEYTLNWIPFGGFVKMLGEEDPSAPGSFASKSKKARLAVLFAGAGMNLITAVIIFAIMFMTGQPEPIGPTYITDIVPGSPADEAGLAVYDIIQKADDAIIETSNDLVEYTKAHKGELVALTILRNGQEKVISLVPRTNPPPGEGAMGIGIHTQYTQAIIDNVTIGGPVAEAGLQAGDLLLSVGGIVAETPQMLNLYFSENPDAPVEVVYQRNNADPVNVSITPAAAPPFNSEEAVLAGLTPQAVPALGAVIEPELLGQRITRLPPGEAVLMGLNTTAGVVVQTFTIPVAVAKNLIPAEQARPVGPLGIYQITDTAVEVSRESNVIYPILFLTAILSTALAVTNLLPLPALDGGRILFILLEAIRGKRIPPEKEGAIHFIGMALLLMLMVVISFYDVTNPVDVSGMFR